MAITYQQPSRTFQQRTSREAQLLLLCARTAITSSHAERIRTLVEQRLDWSHLIQIALHHGVLPLLYRSLNATCPEVVPVAVMKELKGRYHTNVNRNLYLTGELLKLLAAFEAHGIPVIPFKGPALAVSAYGSLGLRQFGDLDILVREQDATHAAELLKAQGYQADPKSNVTWQMPFTRNGVGVDLHWRITPEANYRARKTLSFPFDMERARDRLESVSIAGRSVPHFSPEDALIVHCQNGVKSYFLAAWPQLQWLCDMAELIRNHPHLKWQQILDEAKELGSQRILFLCLYLVTELLGTDLPASVRGKIQADYHAHQLALDVADWLFRERRGQPIFTGYLDRNRFCLRLYGRGRDKASYAFKLARHILIPNEQDRSLLRLPPFLSWAYYGIRPVRLAVIHGKRLLRLAI